MGTDFALTLSIGEYKMAFGMYTVSKAERQAERSKRKNSAAYDRMIRFDIDVADWYQALFSHGWNDTYSKRNTGQSLRVLQCPTKIGSVDK